MTPNSGVEFPTLEQVLASVRPVYEIPEHDLVGEVLVPGLRAADRVEIGVGFFSSHCLSQIAPGLASLIERNVKCRLLVSPELSEEDREAIERGVSDPAAVIDAFMVRLFSEPPETLAAHTADCLAYLIASGTLELRCVLMERGMFHKKLWILGQGSVLAAVHGSGNLTARGLLVNGEQMTIDRPWLDGNSASQRVSELAASFDLEWHNKKAGRLTILPEQLIELLRGRARATNHVPTTDDFWAAWAKDRDMGLAPDLPPGLVAPPSARLLSIPLWLDWHNPPYGHQATAISRLAERNFVGLLAIATGGGKTKTALISCTQIQDAEPRPLLIMILVPTSVLAAQWEEEVDGAAVTPHPVVDAVRFVEQVEDDEVVAGEVGGDLRPAPNGEPVGHLLEERVGERARAQDVAAAAGRGERQHAADPEVGERGERLEDGRLVGRVPSVGPPRPHRRAVVEPPVLVELDADHRRSPPVHFESGERRELQAVVATPMPRRDVMRPVQPELSFHTADCTPEVPVAGRPRQVAAAGG